MNYHQWKNQFGDTLLLDRYLFHEDHNLKLQPFTNIGLRSQPSGDDLRCMHWLTDHFSRQNACVLLDQSSSLSDQRRQVVQFLSIRELPLHPLIIASSEAEIELWKNAFETHAIDSQLTLKVIRSDSFDPKDIIKSETCETIVIHNDDSFLQQTKCPVQFYPLKLIPMEELSTNQSDNQQASSDQPNQETTQVNDSYSSSKKNDENRVVYVTTKEDIRIFMEYSEWNTIIYDIGDIQHSSLYFDSWISNSIPCYDFSILLCSQNQDSALDERVNQLRQLLQSPPFIRLRSYLEPLLFSLDLHTNFLEILLTLERFVLISMSNYKLPTFHNELRLINMNSVQQRVYHIIAQGRWPDMQNQSHDSNIICSIYRVFHLVCQNSYDLRRSVSDESYESYLDKFTQTDDPLKRLLICSPKLNFLYHFFKKCEAQNEKVLVTFYFKESLESVSSLLKICEMPFQMINASFDPMSNSDASIFLWESLPEKHSAANSSENSSCKMGKGVLGDLGIKHIIHFETYFHDKNQYWDREVLLSVLNNQDSISTYRLVTPHTVEEAAFTQYSQDCLPVCIADMKRTLARYSICRRYVKSLREGKSLHNPDELLPLNYHFDPNVLCRKRHALKYGIRIFFIVYSGTEPQGENPDPSEVKSIVQPLSQSNLHIQSLIRKMEGILDDYYDETKLLNSEGLSNLTYLKTRVQSNLFPHTVDLDTLRLQFEAKDIFTPSEQESFFYFLVIYWKTLENILLKNTFDEELFRMFTLNPDPEPSKRLFQRGYTFLQTVAQTSKFQFTPENKALLESFIEKGIPSQFRKRKRQTTTVKNKQLRVDQTNKRPDGKSKRGRKSKLHLKQELGERLVEFDGKLFPIEDSGSADNAGISLKIRFPNLRNTTESTNEGYLQATIEDDFRPEFLAALVAISNPDSM